MKKSFKSILVLFFSMTLLSATTWAYTEIPKEPDTETGGGENADAGENEAANSILEASRNARNRALLISAASFGASLYFGSQCAAGNFGSCAVAAVALSSFVQTAQYANNKQFDITNQKIADQNPPGGGDPAYCQSVHGCSEDSGGDGSAPATEDMSHRRKQLDQMLAGSGFGVDEKGNVTTPQGTYSPNQLTPSTMASLGVTPELQAEYRARMQEEMAKASAQREASAIAEGGSGGPAQILRAQRDSSAWNQPAPTRGLASVDGLSVRRGDDLIGVQSADIFEMVHKKYQQLREQNKFME